VRQPTIPLPNPLRQQGISDEPKWDLPRLHALSVESMKYLKVLVDYGVVQPPWIKDRTGHLGPAPTLEAAVTHLREHKTSISVFRWRFHDKSLESRLFDDALRAMRFVPSSEDVANRLLQDFRKQFRAVRVIWVIDSPASPTLELRNATAELQTFISALNFAKRLDPSLAILAGADDSDEIETPAATSDGVARGDHLLIEDSLDVAEDLATWERNFQAALHMLDEIIGFLKRRAAAAPDLVDQHSYRDQVNRASRLRHDIAANPALYSQRQQARVWTAIGSEGYRILRNTFGRGLTIRVPSADGMSTLRSAEGELEVTAMDESPETGSGIEAPWTYLIQVDVSQPTEGRRLDKGVALTGLPLVLINTTTGVRQIRGLRHLATDDHEFMNSAVFADLAPGIYRVIIPPPPKGHFDQSHVSFMGWGSPLSKWVQRWGGRAGRWISRPEAGASVLPKNSA
jgi:hypothetical protein